MSKVSDAAERGAALIKARFGEDEPDVVMMLADLEAWLLSTGRLSLTTLAKYAHDIHNARKYDDEVWERG